jgi:hypothetical protein
MKMARKKQIRDFAPEEFAEQMEGFFKFFQIRPVGYQNFEVNSQKPEHIARYRECLEDMFNAWIAEE